MSGELETIDARDDAARPAAIERALSHLDAGGAVALPTESLYAIAVRLDADRAREVQRAAAREGWHDSASVHLNAEHALFALPFVTPAAMRLAKRYLPGPLVIAAAMKGDGKPHAVRVPGHPLAGELLARTPSALLFLEPWSLTESIAEPATAATPDGVAARLGGVLAAILDGGRAKLGQPPAVVRADRSGFEVLRAGILTAADLERAAIRRVLFVCAGNTCRSPMAAGLLERELARRLDVTPANLADVGFIVSSAGAYATPGMPASRGARRAMSSRGVDLLSHRSRALDMELLAAQDRVYALTAAIQDDLRYAGVEEKKLFHIDGSDGNDVADPFGGSDAQYEACAAELEPRVVAIADSLLKDIAS